MLNWPTLLELVAQGSGRIIVPLSAYADPVRLEIIGEPDPHPDLARFAEMINRRLAAGRRHDIATGQIQLGEEAFYEAIAFICQMSAVGELLGEETEYAVQRKMREMGGISDIYTWATAFGRDLGITGLVDEVEGIEVFNSNKILPILIAALCSRFSGAPNPAIEGQPPPQRLAQLINYFSEAGTQFRDVDSVGCWDLVDGGVRHLWGLSCVEHMREDVSRERDRLAIYEKKLEERSTMMGVFNAFRDYNNLHSKFVERFASDPNLFTDPLRFPRDLLPQLRPIPVLLRADGCQTGVPLDWRELLGHNMRVSDDKHFKWWWSATPRSWPATEDVFCLAAYAEWLDIFGLHAPVAKYLLYGRGSPDTIPPYIALVEDAIGRTTNQIYLDLPAALPPPVDHEKLFTWLYHDQYAYCDLTNEILNKENVIFVSPWHLRATYRNQEFVRSKLGHSAFAELEFMKDWSLWKIHKKCFEQLDPPGVGVVGSTVGTHSL